tara:strand:- start:209 stop:550 length:342 start_codon:yes stop_codon:yes gene_type:complete
MKSYWCILVSISVLFTSVESAAELLVEGGLPHADDVAAHESEFGHSLEAHEDESSNVELDDEHCTHCCHGHSASITGQFTSLTTSFVARELAMGRSAYVHNFAQAPPTPPPNA